MFHVFREFLVNAFFQKKNIRNIYQPKHFPLYLNQKFQCLSNSEDKVYQEILEWIFFYQLYV